MEPAVGTETLGIDLAARLHRTSGCRIDWAPARPLVRGIDWATRARSLDDARLVALIRDPAFAAVGVDVPFGWPVAFCDLIAGRGTFTSYEQDSSRLRLRRTDHFCAQPGVTPGVTPLSVSADMIAAPAMRWRMLRPHLGASVVRTHEVYPAAALAAWGMQRKDYKKRNQNADRVRILHRLQDELSLEIDDEDAESMAWNHDALDALVAAVVARAIVLGRTRPCPPEMEAEAATEGWIHLPVGSLADLVSR